MSLKAHSLVSSIINQKIMFLGIDVPTSKEHLFDIAKDIDKAPKFDVGVVDSIDFDSEKEELIGNQPYPHFYFEIDIEVNHDFVDDSKTYTNKRLAFFCVQEGNAFSVIVFSIYPDKTMMEAVLPANHGDISISKGICFNDEIANKYLTVFKKVICLLNCSNIETTVVDAPVKLNKKRHKNGNPPIHSYNVVTIKPEQSPKCKIGKTGENTRTSPKLHLRRGHVRKLNSGTTIWVQHSVVGLEESGTVSKEYKISML